MGRGIFKDNKKRLFEKFIIIKAYIITKGYKRSVFKDVQGL